MRPENAIMDIYILEDFENASPYFCTFLAAIEKLLAGFNDCATQNWYEIVLNLTALSRDAVDDGRFLHS